MTNAALEVLKNVQLIGGFVSDVTIYVQNIKRNCKNGFNVEYIFDYGDVDDIDVSFQELMKVSNAFGTVEIDINNKSSTGGCDTCGYGSTTSLTLQILNPTKLVEELSDLVGDTAYVGDASGNRKD